jgi:hypothetical protein
LSLSFFSFFPTFGFLLDDVTHIGDGALGPRHLRSHVAGYLFVIAKLDQQSANFFVHLAQHDSSPFI